MKISILKELVKNLFKKPMTIRFPAQSKPISKNYRGEHSFDKVKCKSCGLCAKICPNKAIEMVEVKQENEIKKYPKIDMGKCCFCGLCQDICPTGAIKLTKSIPKAITDLGLLVKNQEKETSSKKLQKE